MFSGKVRIDITNTPLFEFSKDLSKEMLILNTALDDFIIKFGNEKLSNELT